MDGTGKVLLSNQLPQVGASHARQAYFVKGQEGPYIHPPNYSLYTAAPSIVLAQPVTDDDGTFMGVLAGRLNLDRADSIMKQDAGLGQTGETYLVNAAGLILTPPRFGRDSMALGQEMRTEGVRNGLALSHNMPPGAAEGDEEEEAGWSIYRNYRGQQVLGVYHWFPDLQMVLLAEQEMSETRVLARDVLTTNLVILLLVALAAASIALLVSRRIIGPLEALTGSANLLAAGDLSHKVPHTERGDEIGTLARAISQMSQQLRSLIEGLEEQVARRTYQWQEANYKLQRRAIQLEAVSLVGRAAASILNLDDLLLEVVNLIRSRFDFYHAGIFLLDESGQWAVLRQATGEAGQRMLARKHQLAVGGQSIVGWVTAHRQPRIVLDVGGDTVHFKNPDLPHTRSEAALPLVVGDRLLGALDVQSIEEAAFDEDDVTVLSLMADQVAIAIENAFKFSQQAAILEATSPIYRVSRHIALATNLDDVLAALVEHAAGPHVDRCAIHLYTGDTESEGSSWLEIAALWDRASNPPHMPGTRYPVQPHLRHEMAEPLVVGDLLAQTIDERVDRETCRMLVETLQLRAVLMLPLAAAGRPVGFLFVASRQPHAWTESELRTFRSLSDQAAIVVENVRLLGETKARVAELAALNEVSQALASRLSVQEVLKEVHQGASRLLDATNFYVALYNPDREVVTFPFDATEEEGDRFNTLPANQGLTGYIIRNRTSLLIEENLPQRLAEMGIEMVGMPALSWLGVPMMAGDRVLGVMAVQSYAMPRAYDEHDRDVLTALANQAAIALQNALLFEETQRRAAQERLAGEIAARMRETLDMNSILQTTVREMGRSLSLHDVTIRLEIDADEESPI
jgi:GAF domain-containing protein/HAMP domain-containing protein